MKRTTSKMNKLGVRMTTTKHTALRVATRGPLYQRSRGTRVLHFDPVNSTGSMVKTSMHRVNGVKLGVGLAAAGGAAYGIHRFRQHHARQAPAGGHSNTKVPRLPVV